MSTMEHTNRELTRQLMRKIDGLPAPVKALIGFLPGGGAVVEAAENHKWAIVKLATHYGAQGKLSAAARAALREYELHHQAEGRAYEKLVRLLEREL